MKLKFTGYYIYFIGQNVGIMDFQNKFLSYVNITYLRATPLETSQFNMLSALEAASGVPSKTSPKPPFITSPLFKKNVILSISVLKQFSENSHVILVVNIE